MAESTETHVLELKAELDPSVKRALDALRKAQQSVRDEYANISKEISRLEGTGVNVQPLVRQMDQLGVSVRAMNRAAKDTQSGTQVASTGMDKWRRSIELFEDDISRLPVKIREVQAQLERLAKSGDTSSSTYQAYNAELRKLNDQQAKLTAANTGSVRAFKTLRNSVQNTAFQVTDFAVSLQNGTRASVAFAQQAPQVLGAFGPIGAVLGVVATLVGVFAAKWIDSLSKTLSPANKLAQETKELDKALSSLGVTIDNIDVTPLYDDIIAAQGTLSTALTASLSADLISAATTAKNRLESIKAIYVDGFREIESITETGPRRGRQRTALIEDELKRIQKQFKLSGESAKAYRDLLEDATSVEAVSALIAQTQELGEGNAEFNKQIQELLKALVEFDALQQQLKDNERIRLAEQAGELSKLQAIARQRIQTRLEEFRVSKEFEQVMRGVAQQLNLTAEQMEFLFGKTAKTNDKLKDFRREYERIVESTYSASEQFDAQIKDLERLQKALGAEVDQTVIDRYIESLKKARDEGIKAEILESLDAYNRKLYELGEESEKAADKQEEFAAILFRISQIKGNPAYTDEYLRLVQALGDVAPAALQADAALLKLEQQRENIDGLALAVQNLADKSNLTADEVIALKQSLGILEGQVVSLESDLQGAAVNGIKQFGDTLLEATRTGKLAFDDFAKSVINNVLSMIVQFQLLKFVQQGLKVDLGLEFGGTAAAAAKGAAYVNGIKAFAKGGVVSGPTLFGTQGGLGLMGEAGPEAILPLRRDGTGNLGVEASVNVNVQNYAPATEVVTSQRDNGDVDIIVKSISQKIMRGGNEVSASLERAYGLSRTGGSF